MDIELSRNAAGRAGGRGRLVAVTGAAASVVMVLAGCGDGKGHTGLPEYTSTPSASASPTPSVSVEEAAEAAVLEYYATLRELYLKGSADRKRLSKIASGSALERPLEDLRYYDTHDMHDNGKRTVTILGIEPKGSGAYVRTCYDMRKVRFLVPGGNWGPTLPVNIREEGLTIEPTADNTWKVTANKRIRRDRCNE